MRQNATGIHYQWLDLTRFLAAFLVVLSHARGTVFEKYGALDPGSQGVVTFAFYFIARIGHEAVVVFFVLSGYLVAGKALERMIGGTFDQVDYAIDRVTRIWIPLIPALIFSAFLSNHFPTEIPGVWVWAGNLFGLQTVIVPNLCGNAPLWSLAYEIWFYILAYAIGRQLMRKSVDLISLFLFLSFALVFTKLSVHYLACWIIGALFYLKPHGLSVRTNLLISGPLLIASVIGLQLTSEGHFGFLSEWPDVRPVLELLLAVSTASLCVSLVTFPSNWISRVSVKFSAFSYTLYLVHYPILCALANHGWQRITVLNAAAYGLFALVVLGCLAVSWVMYLMFEKNTAFVRSKLKLVIRRFYPLQTDQSVVP
jgi:peptidoglycan/LPS O-acetylase OafA/YrhL